MKDTITVDELIDIMSKLRDDATFDSVARQFDPEFRAEDFHFLNTQFKKVLNDDSTEGSHMSACAGILKEEFASKTIKKSIVYAIALYGFADYLRGQDHAQRSLTDSLIEKLIPAAAMRVKGGDVKEIMEKIKNLAKETGARVDVVTIGKEAKDE